MTQINWHPSPREMRVWAAVMAAALGVVGSLFYFVDWGIFSGGQGFARFLWSFGAFAFLTGITGTKLGLPAYRLWMGFVWIVSWVITHAALTAVLFIVVTPLAIVARLIGRDRLQLRPKRMSSYWQTLDSAQRHNPERQF
ncbi:MAG: SxtJ family membrane protein [Chthoniobacterales bacterium]